MELFLWRITSISELSDQIEDAANWLNILLIGKRIQSMQNVFCNYKMLSAGIIPMLFFLTAFYP
ncbi:MAG: hypothetical protein DRH12_12885 [Deltaproteobacteria bacterium]|nr:MAG: hypothetical protein DRH12_12885 [Deltaproteobacteria bacterium]